MLTGINPLLTGELLRHLDAMGHSDAIVLADAHFPASRLATRLLDLPGVTVSELLAAIRTVVPPDDVALVLMATADGVPLPVHAELEAAAEVGDAEVRYTDRHDFYRLASEAYLVVRTGERRTFANALYRKGVVG
ncbi:MAG TPA: RbsD/FucU domain-containing protein [Lacisediminihabitans sp.]|uniref:RbsD/FucU family protein n=1 Tax=Lacisediminihabitans sp. TaxID=2787631 RepID=UPI002EDAECD0